MLQMSKRSFQDSQLQRHKKVAACFIKPEYFTNTCCLYWRVNTTTANSVTNDLRSMFKVENHYLYPILYRIHTCSSMFIAFISRQSINHPHSLSSLLELTFLTSYHQDPWLQIELRLLQVLVSSSCKRADRYIQSWVMAIAFFVHYRIYSLGVKTTINRFVNC